MRPFCFSNVGIKVAISIVVVFVVAVNFQHTQIHKDTKRAAHLFATPSYYCSSITYYFPEEQAAAADPLSGPRGGDGGGPSSQLLLSSLSSSSWVRQRIDSGWVHVNVDDDGDDNE